jgi:hypothetical protein
MLQNKTVYVLTGKLPMTVAVLRTPLTTLRINIIEVKPQVGVRKEIEGLDGKIF